MEEEIWKDIPRYIGYYQASNLGRIRALESIYKNKIRIINGYFHKSGTHYCSILICNKKYVEVVAYLILEAFSSPKDYKKYIKHIDGNPSNNNLLNLSWSNKRTSRPPIIINQFDLSNNFIKQWQGLEYMCEQLKLSISSVSKLINNKGKCKTCGGFIFKKIC